jgi:endonuclease YncB( thermonuclease family)
MTTHLARTHAAKIIGTGILAVSLLAMTGCASAAPTTKPAVDNGTPAAATATATAKPEDDSLRGKLVRVIDGDTVELSPVSNKNGQPTGEPSVTVHILGIDAPAIDACGGPESAAELKRIIDSDGFFRVKFIPEAARTDSKGNTQGYLYSGDGTGVPSLVGYGMVQNGYASVWYEGTDRPGKNHDRDAELDRIAKEQKLGIWAKCVTS